MSRRDGTTLELLNYWRRDGRGFRFFFAQLEAAETIILSQAGGVSGRVVKAGRRETVPEIIHIGPKTTTARGRRYLTSEEYSRQASLGMIEVIDEEKDNDGNVKYARVTRDRYVVAIDQFGGGSRQEPDVRPLFKKVTGLEGRPNDALGDEIVETSSTIRPRCRARENQLGDHASVRRNRDTRARLDPAYVATQVILQLAGELVGGPAGRR